LFSKVKSVNAGIAPPITKIYPGWARVNVLGVNEWVRSTEFPRTGVASAFMNYQVTGGEDWLLTPQFNVTAGDSIIFWLSIDFVDFPQVTGLLSTFILVLSVSLLGLTSPTS